MEDERGQLYDDAANKSGKKGGVETLLKLLNPKSPALYPLLRTCIKSFCERCMFSVKDAFFL